VSLRPVGRLCVCSLFVAACGGSASEPTRTTTTATDAFTLYAAAFVRDDGVYSPPIACGGGGSSGGAFAGQPVEVAGVLGPLPSGGGVRTDSQRFGNLLYQFARGRRINAVLLLKRMPAAPTGPASGCTPLGTAVPGFTNVTEGTVFPENADQRVDMTLNWLIQG
jgi:hypothetical protein